MSAGPDRSIRFVFDSVADRYVSGRPDMPPEAVRGGAEAVGLRPGARVLEIGAGAGQLTATLLEAGFDVVALEPGGELRRRAEARAPAASFRSQTFEDFEAEERFDAVLSSNAFHWLDPETAYDKAANVADALVLIWNTPFVSDPELRRRVQGEVMIPHGSAFPTEEPDVRRFVADETAAACARVRDSGRFEDPWSHVYERTLGSPGADRRVPGSDRQIRRGVRARAGRARRISRRVVRRRPGQRRVGRGRLRRLA